MTTVWKIAPGNKAYLWPESRDEGYITINWMNPKNFTKFKTLEQLKSYLITRKLV